MTDTNATADSMDTTWRLPPILDLAAAGDFLGQMRQRLGQTDQLTMDASAVETLTLPCIQIILAAMRSDARMKIERPSAAFVSAFDDLGLEWGSLQHGDRNQDPQDQYVDQDPALTAVEAPGRHQDENEAGQDGLPSHDLDQVIIEEIHTQAAGDEQMQGDGSQSSGCPVESSTAKRILTIDDSKTIRDMLMLTLVDAGFDVVQAVDGQEGIEVLDREGADLVITDINMPRMDGYEVIRRLRDDPNHKTTPILVLTTESETEKKDLARQAGATGWMVKPFDPDRLVATIRKVAP